MTQHVMGLEGGQPSGGLHVAPVLAADFVQGVADLPQRVVLDRVHELLEQVAAFAGCRLQGGGAWGIGCARSFAALRMTTSGTLQKTGSEPLSCVMVSHPSRRNPFHPLDVIAKGASRLFQIIVRLQAEPEALAGAQRSGEP